MRRRAKATDWHAALFKRELGLTPWRLVRECRLGTASKLLAETSLGTKEIASGVGLSSKRALRKLFRDLADLKPSEKRDHSRQLPANQRALVEELFSWSFKVRYHRGELEVEVLRAALAHLKGRLLRILKKV